MSEQQDAESLMAEIKSLKQQRADAEAPKQRQTTATRMSVEMVSGVLVGAFLGYHVDAYFDTSPIFFILCFFLGVAGGAFNLYKLATAEEQEELN